MLRSDVFPPCVPSETPVAVAWSCPFSKSSARTLGASWPEEDVTSREKRKKETEVEAERFKML